VGNAPEQSANGGTVVVVVVAGVQLVGGPTSTPAVHATSTAVAAVVAHRAARARVAPNRIGGRSARVGVSRAVSVVPGAERRDFDPWAVMNDSTGPKTRGRVPVGQFCGARAARAMRPEPGRNDVRAAPALNTPPRRALHGRHAATTLAGSSRPPPSRNGTT